MENWCNKCQKKKRCAILTGSVIGIKSEKWVYDKQGQPKCESFVEIGTPHQKKNKIDLNQPTLF